MSSPQKENRRAFYTLLSDLIWNASCDKPFVGRTFLVKVERMYLINDRNKADSDLHGYTYNQDINDNFQTK